MRDITPEVVRSHKFKTRFRGFDVKEVRILVEQVCDEMDRLFVENQELHFRLAEKNKKLEEVSEHNRKLNATLAEMREAAKSVEERAQKHADLIISKAELTAEKILNNAHMRVAQLHDDLAELKRQRTHFEVKLRSFIEAHLKFLDMEKESHHQADELDGKLRFLNKG